MTPFDNLSTVHRTFSPSKVHKNLVFPYKYFFPSYS
nr:MAG TPA: hypothetical protein [Microviridae sp.]